MKVTVVTHDSIYGRYVAATLRESGAADRIVIETASAGWRFYLRKLRAVGPLDFAFQAYLNRWFRREGRKHLPDRPLPPHERIRSINDCTFAPDELVIGFGTSYVRASTFERAPNGILNLHTGLLPEYRGVKSEFWALAARDANAAGWTLHYMTARLDEGDIVLRRSVPVSGENPAALRARILRDAVPEIAAFIARTRSAGLGSIPRTPQGEGGRYFTTPTLRDWRAYRRRARTTARTVPSPTD
jgi:hypothetical protein